MGSRLVEIPSERDTFCKYSPCSCLQVYRITIILIYSLVLLSQFFGHSAVDFVLVELHANFGGCFHRRPKNLD